MTATPAELHLLTGLPGFPHDRNWGLIEVDGGPFAVMGSFDSPGLELLVTMPHCFFDGYEVDVPDNDAERLGLESAEDALVLVVVTTGDRPEEATANLLAPIVVNVRTRQAAQLVVGSDLSDLRRPLFEVVSAA